MPILTEELLRAGRSNKQGYSLAQLLVVGLVLTPGWRSNWRKYLLGREISAEAYQEFLRLRDQGIDTVKSRTARERDRRTYC